jgi:hypothetical protein
MFPILLLLFTALVNVSNIIQENNESHKRTSNATEIKWTPDLSYLAVGFNDGYVASNICSVAEAYLLLCKGTGVYKHLNYLLQTDRVVFLTQFETLLLDQVSRERDTGLCLASA